MNIFTIITAILVFSGITAYVLKENSTVKIRKIHSYILIPIILLLSFIMPLIVAPIIVVYLIVTYKREGL